MFPVIKDCLKSGLSLAAFARESEIKYATLIYWLNRYRDQEIPTKDSQPASHFVRLSAVDRAVEFVVELPGGIKLRLDDQLSDRRLAVLLKELSQTYA